MQVTGRALRELLGGWMHTAGHAIVLFLQLSGMKGCRSIREMWQEVLKYCWVSTGNCRLEVENVKRCNLSSLKVALAFL